MSTQPVVFATHRGYVLALYREIIRSARAYPSIKREQVIQDVRLEFRQNKNVTDESAVNALLDKAEHSLGVLRRYQMLDKSSSDWTIQL